MALSEIMTIVMMFHLSHYRTFKDFYLCCILGTHKKDFPKAVSYNRFVELQPSTLMPLFVFLLTLQGEQTGIYYVDSTKLPVCHNLRISRHKVFKGLAQRGKTSTGWFFGFKLHLVFNHKGEIMNFCLSPGNVDDRNPITDMMKKLKGWLFGDRGYISKSLTETLRNQGVELITNVKKNMKKVIIQPLKKFLLSKRGIVETIIDQLKNILHIDHTRHRSPVNFQVNVLAGLLAYILRPRKVSVAMPLPPHHPLLTSN